MLYVINIFHHNSFEFWITIIHFTKLANVLLIINTVLQLFLWFRSVYHEVKEFELCHNLKTASIHFSWYKAYYQGDDSEKIDYTGSLDEDIPLTVYLKDVWYLSLIFDLVNQWKSSVGTRFLMQLQYTKIVTSLQNRLIRFLMQLRCTMAMVTCFESLILPDELTIA